MTHKHNHLGQPVGDEVPNWQIPSLPPRQTMQGRYCRLDPTDVNLHAEDLYVAVSADQDGRGWTYLPYGPFTELDQYRTWMISQCQSEDPMFFTIVDYVDEKPAGIASYLRIKPRSGSIEVGHIHFSPRLQQHRAATESMYLMMKQAFELGYRRFEWKCDALNAASRAAAKRIGLSFEGVFRYATVYKGRNRDTAWFAAVADDWPALKHAFESWLEPTNFDAHGRQHSRLSDLTRPLVDRTPFC